MGVDQTARTLKETEMEAGIQDFLERFNQPTYRGIRAEPMIRRLAAGGNRIRTAGPRSCESSVGRPIRMLA